MLVIIVRELTFDDLRSPCAELFWPRTYWEGEQTILFDCPKLDLE
jgi:hypothetical protein